MKMLSDKAVTKEEIAEIDKKQTKQIKQLRLALAVGLPVVFLINLCVTLMLHFAI